LEQKNQRDQTSAGSWHSPYDLICTALAFALGLAIGWLDLHTTEVVATILPLLAAGLLLGLLQPAVAWRWAVLLVIGLPTMAAIARLTDAETAEPAQLDVRIVLVAFAFALVGAYAGVLIRRALRTVKSGSR
jgi:hypothetical protein